MISLAMSGPGFSYRKDQITKFDYRYLTQKGIEGLNYAKDQAVRLDYNHLFTEVSDRIKAHPYQTAFHVVNGVVFLAPGLVTGPILWGMGFSPLGPVAGKLSSMQGCFRFTNLIILNRITCRSIPSNDWQYSYWWSIRLFTERWSCWIWGCRSQCYCSG
jgi:hypothetical protein